MSENSVVFGPFIGDFKTEVLSFLPYIQWIQNSFNFENVYVNSHFNREFLYRHLYTEFIPVYKHLTRNETNQIKNLHKYISKKDFENFSKDLKSYSTNQYFIPYVKYQNNISIFQKSFQKINSDYIPPEKDYILFIPDKICNISVIKNVYSYLKDKYDIIVVGDLKTHLLRENILIKQTNYIDSGYSQIIGYINNANMVITPCSHWTAICNLNKIPVSSWGDQVSPYKPNGNYYFDNKYCMTLPFSKNSNKKILNQQIEYFINKNK
jgi:hypothetical protein